MMKSTQNIFREKEEVAMGESCMKEHIGYPLKLSYTVVLVCRKGRAVVSVNFKNYLLKVNDILVLSEDSVTIILRTSEDFKLFYCMIDKSFAPEIAYNLPNQLFLFLHESPLCIPEKSELSLLEMWLEQVWHIKLKSVTYQHIMMRNHLQNFFLEIAEKIPQTSSFVRHEYSRREMLSWKFWNMVGIHCTKHRDVAFYAKELCITPYYLSQITKDVLNDSPKDLISRQVVLEIKALLSSTDMSIKEIAEQLHFEDTSYMCRYFKRQTGISLSGYRN